jgi:hypothetical protein
MAGRPQNELVSKDFEVEKQVTALGLSVPVIRNSVKQAEMARDACSPNLPIIVPPILCWGEVVRNLCDHYRPRGWEFVQPHNLPMLVAPDDSLALVVMPAIQLDGARPLLKKPLGPMKADLVSENGTQLSWLDPLTLRFRKDTNSSGRPTWFLLWQRTVTPKYDRILVQLGLPSAGETSEVDLEWARRLILAPIDMTSGPKFGGNGSDGSKDEAIVVEVSRRR